MIRMISKKKYKTVTLNKIQKCWLHVWMYLINFYVSYANSDEITRELKMKDEVWKELRENVTALKKHKNILFQAVLVQGNHYLLTP